MSIPTHMLEPGILITRGIRVDGVGCILYFSYVWDKKQTLLYFIFENCILTDIGKTSSWIATSSSWISCLKRVIFCHCFMYGCHYFGMHRRKKVAHVHLFYRNTDIVIYLKHMVYPCLWWLVYQRCRVGWRLYKVFVELSRMAGRLLIYLRVLLLSSCYILQYSRQGRDYATHIFCWLTSRSKERCQ